jgi:hypothetical protein
VKSHEYQKVRHILHFLQQSDAEKAGSYLYERLKINVTIYTGRVVFCTNGLLDNLTQIGILQHTNPYRPIFNLKEASFS